MDHITGVVRHTAPQAFGSDSEWGYSPKFRCSFNCSARKKDGLFLVTVNGHDYWACYKHIKTFEQNGDK